MSWAVSLLVAYAFCENVVIRLSDRGTSGGSSSVYWKSQ